METAVSFRLQCTLVLLLQLAFLFQAPFANVIVVDGLVPELKTLAVILGDTMVFKHKNLHVLYIFHSRRDFATCNFNQATLLHSGNLTTSFTWRPSRPGNYYFSFSNSTVGVCKKEWRIKIRVLPSQQSPGLPPIPAPSPTPGGNLHPPLPHDLALASPSPASEPFLPLPDVTPPPSLPIPPVFPGSVGQIPFISSSPAIPIPTGETGDSATVRPLPATGDGNKVAGIGLKRIQMRTLLFLMMALFAF